MSQINILLWDAEGDPKTNIYTKKFTVFWSNYSPKDFCNSISIPELVESDANNLRKRYIAWIYEIGETIIKSKKVVDHFSLQPGLNIWSMSLLVEKCNFSKSTYITDVIKIMAFMDWVTDKNVKSIQFISSNRNLAKVLRNWCSENDIYFEWSKLKSSFLSPSSKKIFITKILPHSIQAFFWFLKYITIQWSLHGVGKKNWNNSDGDITFISYLFNINKNSIANRTFNSSYWGPLPETIADKGLRSNWLHLYVEDRLLPTARDAAKYIKGINLNSNGKQFHTTLHSFFSLRIFLKTILNFLHLLNKGMLLNIARYMPRLGGINVYPFFENDWKRSFFGINAINNILNFHLFHEAFSSIKQQKLAFYLLENQGWERAMVASWRLLGHGEINGYAHATIRFWDLRYFNDLRSEKCVDYYFTPDKLVVNGPEAKKICSESGFPISRLLEVEALRYLYINHAYRKRQECKAIQILKHSSNFSQKKIRLLILTDYTESQTRFQLNILSKVVFHLPLNLSVLIKPHPGYLVSTVEYPNLKYSLADTPLSELLLTADVVYASSITSAAADAYCIGLPVIIALDQAMLNLSPLRNFKDVNFVSSPQELLNAINMISSVSNSNYKPQEVFNLDDSLQKWKEVLVGV